MSITDVKSSCCGATVKEVTIKTPSDYDSMFICDNCKLATNVNGVNLLAVPKDALENIVHARKASRQEWNDAFNNKEK